MKDLIKRLELEINRTPTGELRNLLCDLNIVIQGLDVGVIRGRLCNDSDIDLSEPIHYCTGCGKYHN